MKQTIKQSHDFWSDKNMNAQKWHKKQHENLLNKTAQTFTDSNMFTDASKDRNCVFPRSQVCTNRHEALKTKSFSIERAYLLTARF